MEMSNQLGSVYSNPNEGAGGLDQSAQILDIF